MQSKVLKSAIIIVLSAPLLAARYEYATTAEARGINVIIAGAGGAAWPGQLLQVSSKSLTGLFSR